MTGYRIEPTPEDVAIMGRRMGKLMTAMREAKTPARDVMPAIKRMAADYMHFGPAPSVVSHITEFNE